MVQKVYWLTDILFIGNFLNIAYSHAISLSPSCSFAMEGEEVIACGRRFDREVFLLALPAKE